MIVKETVKIGEQVITLETGRIAKQAHGAVMVSCGETVVLVTVCGNQDPRPGVDFLPLSVDYVEKSYAAGKIPGGFFKREGRLRDSEVLTSRLIDRPCRPLFPEGYRNDVQVIATVLSADKSVPADMLALLGASAALHISNIPWDGPIGGVRVGRVNGELIANPTYAQMAQSDLDLVVAASKDAIVMVEGECHETNERDLLEALFFAHSSVQPFIQLTDKIRQAVGKDKWTFEAPAAPAGLAEKIKSFATERVKAACNISEKFERYGAFKQVKKETLLALADAIGEETAFAAEIYEDLRYHTMRAQILDEAKRVDGRDTTTVRPIAIEVGLLPRTHGSALFTRGETQAIVTSTLGTAQDEQRIEGLVEEGSKRFLLHYNFPPFSVGEVKMLRGAGRREVGHGNLAERALINMLPSEEEFPYTIRIVSEITESNGSSSMATVCGGTLAMLDAGIPLRKPVAGVAMGLIKTGERYAILTDILGDEDHLGDMDFKVCGTADGVTAIQMDIKIAGLTREILQAALEQARQARLHVLGKMAESLNEPRKQLSPYAPRISTIKVKPDQVRLVIGPGGKTIKGIIEQTGVSIDVEDDGTVHVASSDPDASNKALEMIRGLTIEPEVGQVYKGTVRRIEAYGAFIEITPNHDGMVHISDMDWAHIEKVQDVMNLGDEVEVKVTNVDRDGRIRLSRKELLPKPEGYVERPERPRTGGGGGGRGPRREGGRNGERSNDRFRR